MSSLRKLAGAAFVLLLSLNGCADKVSRSFILQPGPGEFAITGHVRVLARLAGDFSEDSLGVRAVDDASGIRVRLEKPDGGVDSALTRSGAYEFRVDAPGLYRVSCGVFPAESLDVTPVIVSRADVAVSDTLTILPSGYLSTYPNPFAVDGVAIEFQCPAPQEVEISVVSVAGVTARRDLINMGAIFFHYHWPGIDQVGNPVPNGLYWVSVRLNGVHHLDLVFKD